MSDFITLDELLQDPEPLDLITKKKNPKTGKFEEATLRLYVRRLTDIERDMASNAANGARRRMREVLNDEKSEERRLLLVEPLEDADDASLRDLWIKGELMRRAPEIQHHSLEEREVVDEPEGLVSPKERDDYDQAVRRAENDRMENLIKAISSVQKEIEAESEALPKGQLRDAAIPAHIETLLAKHWNEVYTSHVIARGTFNDKRFTKPTFKTTADVDKFRSQRPAMYTQLADTHRGLLLELEPTLGF